MNNLVFRIPGLAFAAALTIVCGNASADPVTGITLGAALIKFGDQAQQIVDQGRSAGLAWEMKAGGEVALAVANVQNAYQDSLTKTFNDGVNPSLDATMSQLGRLVQDLQTGAITTEADALSRAQVVTSTLPFHNGAPQVSTVEPGFVVPSRTSYPVTVAVRGNFEVAALKGMTPTLVVGPKTYQPSSITNQALTFQVPVGELFPKAVDQASGFNTTTASLTVPWSESHLLGLWHTRSDYRYPVVVAALPLSPGKLSITKLVPMTHEESKEIVAHGHVCSTHECGNDDRIDVPVDVTLDPASIAEGWHIRPGSCTYGETSIGDHSHSQPNQDGNRCVASVTTIHHRFGSSGSVDWEMRAVAVHTVTVITKVDEPIDIAWGEERQLPYKAEEWEKINFDPFAGGHSELSTMSHNPFVTVTQLATGKVSVAAADPRTLRWMP